MKRIFSGIQPTGRKHLGNYIGAITRYVAGQDSDPPTHGLYCIVDLHAITVAYDPANLRASSYDLAALLLAAGLDPQRCTFFRQSDVPEHTYLSWLLSSVTAKGDLERMHQFKEKSQKQKELSSAGLFTYPVLMAADVLAYRADEVPVGDDQRQHVELMRDIAERFNARFGQTLTVPAGSYPTVGARIMDLQNPAGKMSTTADSPQGTIYILDEPNVVAKKIKSAVTDSGREVTRGPGKEGVTNLLEIFAAVRGITLDSAEAEFAGGNGYGQFKQAVADAVIEYLEPVRARYQELRADEAELDRILSFGAGKAQPIAAATVADVKQAMGFGAVRTPS